jgi:hypothetical protein
MLAGLTAKLSRDCIHRILRGYVTKNETLIHRNPSELSGSDASAIKLQLILGEIFKILTREDGGNDGNNTTTLRGNSGFSFNLAPPSADSSSIADDYNQRQLDPPQRDGHERHARKVYLVDAVSGRNVALVPSGPPAATLPA